MSQLLQNQPNHQKFPVKGVAIIAERLNQQQKIISPLYALMSSLLVITTLIGLTISGILIYLLLTDKSINVAEGAEYFFGGIWGGTILSVIALIALFTHIIRIPIKEQLRYYQQGNLKPLLLEKRQALSLRRVNDYTNGFWGETLEHYPLASRVAHDHYKYRILHLSPSTDHQAGLYEDWGIVDNEGYQDALEALWMGMHSRSFAIHMATANNVEEMVKKIATLMEVTPQYLYEATKSNNNRPPELLWGFDLHRAIVLSGNCFCAGFITEERAWADILKTADLVYEIFPNFDAFYTNYRLGHAYWSNNFADVKDRLKQFSLYKEKCDWPVKNLPWPEPKGVFIQKFMYTGFSEEIQQIILEMHNAQQDEGANNIKNDNTKLH